MAAVTSASDEKWRPFNCFILVSSGYGIISTSYKSLSFRDNRIQSNLLWQRGKARCDTSNIDAAVCPRSFHWIKHSTYTTCHFMYVQLTNFIFACLRRSFSNAICHMYWFDSGHIKGLKKWSLYQVLYSAGHSVRVLYYINEHTLRLFVHFHILSFRLLRFQLNSFTFQATNNTNGKVIRQSITQLCMSIRWYVQGYS